MADKNWQAGGKILIPARAVVCLIATVASFGAAWGLSDNFAPTSYVGSADPHTVWEMLIGGIVFCNDRYLEIYSLTRSDIPRNMTGPELLELRRKRGILDISVADFYANAGAPEGLVTELPGGRSILVKYFALPNGGSVATHEDCSEQRKLSRQLASTKQFLESVLDNVPVCVAAKSIEDGRYIFANRA